MLRQQLQLAIRNIADRTTSKGTSTTLGRPTCFATPQRLHHQHKLTPIYTTRIQRSLSPVLRYGSLATTVQRFTQTPEPVRSQRAAISFTSGLTNRAIAEMQFKPPAGTDQLGSLLQVPETILVR